MNKLLVVPALASIMATGCASIVSESTYPVAITSTPVNVAFVVENEKGEAVHTGHTPETVQVKEWRWLLLCC